MSALSNVVASPLFGGLLIFLFLGGLLFAYGILRARLERKKTILKRMSSQESFQGYVDLWLDRFGSLTAAEEKLGHSLAVIGSKLTPRAITKIRLAAGGVGFLIAFLFRNWLIALPLAFLCQMIPLSFIEVSVKRLQNIYERQIAEAFQVFVTDYTTTKKVMDTLLNMCPKLKYPLRREFERLARNLHSGARYEQAFMDFANRTQSKWTKVFAQMMITYFREGTDFTEQMIELIKQIATEQMLAQENNTEVASLRFVNILLNISVPVAYVINRLINPENTRIFVETSTGRTLMLFIVLCCVLSLYVGKKITNV